MIKKKKTYYYELDWSENYGEKREKIYLAIQGKIEKYDCLNLVVGNVGYCWHETWDERIKEVSKRYFFKNANSKNIARFYRGFLEDNVLLNYPKKWMESFNEYEPHFTDSIKNYKIQNKSSVKLELKKLRSPIKNKTLLIRKKEEYKR